MTNLLIVLIKRLRDSIIGFYLLTALRVKWIQARLMGTPVSVLFSMERELSGVSLWGGEQFGNGRLGIALQASNELDWRFFTKSLSAHCTPRHGETGRFSSQEAN